LFNIKKFSLKELQENLEMISVNLNKRNYKERKIIHIGLINQLINFFKSEYPDINRYPLKDLLSFLIEIETKAKGVNSSNNETKTIAQFSRKKKTDTLIVAGLQLLIDNGFDENEAIIKARHIINTKNEIFFQKLLKLYKSNLLHPNMKKLLNDLKEEAKKRANIEDAANVYFEKAFQNTK
tara:strand:- start:542 stop:1084 length:543 start_codon:yes stop_codon:yes gene_type:complete